MTSDEYHASEGVSKSKLDVADVSARHYWLKYLNPNKKEEEKTKEHFIVGRASHSAVLEPEDFESSFVTIPENAPNRPTKAQLKAVKKSDAALSCIAWWDDFDEENKGKTALTQMQYQDCLEYRDCVWSNSTASGMLSNGLAEQSHFAKDPETGLLLKCRPDYNNHKLSMMTDLKFVRDASDDGFGRACGMHRYDVQAAFYPDVYKMAEGDSDIVFTFIAIEKGDYGPVIGIYYADDEMVRSGRNKWRRNVNMLAKCYENDDWPGYGAGLPVKFPKYKKDLL